MVTKKTWLSPKLKTLAVSKTLNGNFTEAGEGIFVGTAGDFDVIGLS